MAIHYTYGGSVAGRLLQCPAYLKACEPLVKVQTSNAYAERGTNLHNIQEHLRLMGLSPGDINIAAMYPDLDEDELEDYISTTELVYNWCEDILDKYNIDMIIPEPLVKAGVDVGGSIDILAYNNEYALVLDYKMGHVTVKAQDNAQGLFYHWAARLDDRYSKYVEGKKLIFVILQPSQQKPAIWEIPDGRLDQFEIDYINAMELSKSDDPPFGAGDYCQFCGNLPYCEKQKSYAQRALDIPPKQKQSLSESLTLMFKLKSWMNAVMKEAESVMQAGESVKGYKLVNKQARRSWLHQKEVIQKVMELDDNDRYFEPAKLISPAKMDKLKNIPDELQEVFDNHIVKQSSGTTVAPDSDRREAVQVGVTDELKNLVKNKK